MYWREVKTPIELEEYISFEQSIFPASDWTSYNEYEDWIAQRNLKIYLLTVDYGMQHNKVPTIIGSFSVFIENNVAYMGNFALGLSQRGFRLSRRLTDKLLEEYKTYEIICKTNPKHQIMRKVLLRAGFTNKIDKFEKGRLWSYWSRLPD